MTQNLWNRFKDELLGFIRSRVTDDALAQDMLQEIFIKIHLKAKTINDGTKLSAWVYQITRNTIIDFYRKKKWLVHSNDLPEFFEETTENGNTLENFEYCLGPFIDQLPDIYKEALSQTSLEGLSQKEYAHSEGISYSAAKSRIQRGRDKLKALFVECCAIETDAYGNVIASKQDDCSCS